MRCEHNQNTLQDVDIAEFLEARLDEEEEQLRRADTDPSASPLVLPMLAECAQKRAILDSWKLSAAAEGISDTADAQGEQAIARRSMLRILAAGYEMHPDFDPEWGASLD